MRLTNNLQKLIRSLSLKKNRDERKLFVAEGAKIICDIINSGIKPEYLCATKTWINSNLDVVSKFENIVYETIETEMSKISSLNNPPDVLAVFNQFQPNLADFFKQSFPPILFLDEMQDPGNLGTVIRTADWFGIKHIVCTPNSVDCYNSKVVQASMGSNFRVNIVYAEISDFFSILPVEYDVVGMFMVGKSIHDFKFNPKSVIVIGNEGKGISKEVQTYISERISIPKQIRNFGNNEAESLNASIAAAIVCFEFAKNIKN